ncbi:MAG: type II toxin-antitoxin system HipA family toxin [Planctomycetota bacterium]
MPRELGVWLGDDHVGVLAQSDDGAKSFAYLPDWLARADARAISLSLPLQESAFDDRITRAFFGGLLPEGEVRERLARSLGRSARNEFALLEIIGRECAGALSIVPRGEAPLQNGRTANVALDIDELAKILGDLPRRPLHIGGETRLSLAGAQDKLALVVRDDAFELPSGGTPSTHILKTPIAGFEDSVLDELFCLRLAERLALPVAPAKLLRIAGMDVLCVERFDRRRDVDGSLRRVHQEDICQALGIPADLKYQGEGGPGFPRLFQVLREHAQRPAADVLALLRAAVFVYVIGNGDAHAKNFALLHHAHGCALAPLYDQLCTTVYPSLSTSLAMRIGSARRFDEVDAAAFARFAKDCGIGVSLVRSNLELMASRLPSAIDEVLAAEPALAASRVVADLVRGARERIDRVT